MVLMIVVFGYMGFCAIILAYFAGGMWKRENWTKSNKWVLLMSTSYLVMMGSGMALRFACSVCTADAESVLERLASVFIENIVLMGIVGILILLSTFWILPAMERIKARYEAKLKE